MISGGEVMLRPLITLSEEGVVVAIEQWERLDNMAQTMFHSGTIIPKMVNAHCHLELSYLKGEIPRGCGFAGFAAHLKRVRDNFSEEQRLQAIAAADRKMASEGIAAVGDIANGEESFLAHKTDQIEYHTFAEVYGYKDNMQQAEALLQHPNTSLTPHSTYSLQSESFARVVEHSQGRPLSIHLLESESERELYRGEGGLAEWYRAMGWEWDFTRMYASPVERLIAQIPPHRELLLVHCCYITEEEVERLTDHFSKVTFVLCPASNDYISGVLPPAEMLYRKGCRVAIGTDSLASAESLSMWDNLSLLRGVPAEVAVKWATEGGAEALGCKHSGRIEIGARGVALVDRIL